MKKTNRRRPAKLSKEGTQPFFSESTSTTPFFQPQLEIDPINSPMEKEADAAAERIVNHPQAESSSSSGVQAKKIQRQAAEEEKTAAKRIQRAAEEEPAAKLIQKATEEEPAAKLIQRMEKEEPAAKLIQRSEEEQTVAKLIQRQAKAEQENAPSLEAQIQATKGSGAPLPEDIRLEMEQEFGADFTQVRVHTDTTAIEMTQSIQAHAFTHGYDIYFNAGRFDPYSKSGKELLAHELAHVVQQKGA